MQFTLRGLQRQVAGHAAALAAVVALFAFIGPFGTYDSMGPLGRVGYWLLAMSGNWSIWAGSMLLTLYLTQDWPIRRRGLALALGAVLAAVPGTAIVFAAETLFRPGYVGLDRLPEIYLGVAVIGLVISAAVLAIRSRPAPQEERAPAAAPPRFLDRLPHRIGRDLVYLRMADHYVEAFTTEGSDLVLMRFADAIAELKEADGMRVHRSYWVARGHVTGSTRENGRPTLHLTGGHKVPVSRTYLPEVRAAGLL
ncbi:MAG: LytTR family transcriptional regulator [Alphaproteobacteria bacterium]|nr:LytTR family transcriptional regulator [Alphaproteobacteria bacterium]